MLLCTVQPRCMPYNKPNRTTGTFNVMILESFIIDFIKCEFNFFLLFSNWSNDWLGGRIKAVAGKDSRRVVAIWKHHDQNLSPSRNNCTIVKYVKSVVLVHKPIVSIWKVKSIKDVRLVWNWQQLPYKQAKIVAIIYIVNSAGEYLLLLFFLSISHWKYGKIVISLRFI